MRTSIRLAGHLIRRARRLIKASQYATAATALEGLDGADALYLLGLCCLRLRRRKAARRHLRRAARLRPGHAGTHALLGRVDPDNAAQHLLRAAELSPADARRKAAAGLALVRSGDHDAGLGLLREAVRMSGEYVVLRRLVAGLCDAGLPGDAERAITAARFAAPRCPRLLGLLGKVRCGQGRREDEDAGPVLLPFPRVEGEPRGDAVASVLPGPHTLRLRRGPALGRSS